MAKRILIIDDDASVRTLFSESLATDGYEVVVASDGEQGLIQMQAGGFDLVLLDVMLPKLDGLGILSELQVHPPKAKNGKIILFSSLHDDPAVKEGLTKGASGSIVKSDLAPDILLSKIKALLQ